jgi:hypothetical protein
MQIKELLSELAPPLAPIVPASSGSTPPTQQSTTTPSGDGNTIVKVVQTGPGWNIVQTGDGKTQKRVGVRNWRNNNPGNIMYGSFAKSAGAIGTDGRYAIFPTLELGAQAKKKLVFGPKYISLSIRDAISKYAPPSENNTDAYIKSIVKATGANDQTRLQDLDDQQKDKLLQAISRMEGFKVGQILPIETPAA